MEAKQLFEFVNEAQMEALGERALTMKNTSDFVSLGEVILSSEKNIDEWYRVLPDRIGRTWIKYRRYYADRNNKIQRNPLDFGVILQKIQTYKMAKASKNGSYGGQVNPFAKEKDTTDIMCSLFSAKGVFEVEPKIVYDVQLKDSFLSESAMTNFINLIFSDMYNALEYEIEQLEKLTRATMIAQAFKSPNKLVRRNVLAEYNTKFADSLTTTNCIYDKEFERYVTMEVNKVVKRFPKMTSLFNGVGADRFTPTQDICVDLLSDFASAQATYLSSDVYHKELVALPRYDGDVDSWQTSGTDYSFESVSKIDILDESGVHTSVGGILGVVYDIDACAVLIERIRTRSMYNGGSELTNYFHKADWASVVDSSENCVVFYVADEDDANPSLDIDILGSSTQIGSIKTVGDLQDGITINGNVINGTLNYVEGFSDMFPNTPNGNFLALKFTSDEGATISAKVVGATETTDYQTLDSDGILVVRVHNKSQGIIVKSVKGDKLTTYVLSLDGLELLGE